MSRCSVGTSRIAAADRFVLTLAAVVVLGFLVTSTRTTAVVVGLLAVVLMGVLVARRVMRRFR